MITILNAWTQRGWSSQDYRIDDSRLAEVVGRSYATVEHARRAVEARADELGYPSFEYECRGRRYRYDCSSRLRIPGRRVPQIIELDHK